MRDASQEIKVSVNFGSMESHCAAADEKFSSFRASLTFSKISQMSRVAVLQKKNVELHLNIIFTMETWSISLKSEYVAEKKHRAFHLNLRVLPEFITSVD